VPIPAEGVTAEGDTAEGDIAVVVVREWGACGHQLRPYSPSEEGGLSVAGIRRVSWILWSQSQQPVESPLFSDLPHSGWGVAVAVAEADG
jgi:hypothetical protein